MAEMSCTGNCPNLARRPMPNRCHVRGSAQTFFRPPRQRSCNALEFVQMLFGRPVGRYVMYGNLPTPCLAAQSADMLCTGICPSLDRPPMRQRFRVRKMCPTLVSIVSAAALSCTGICPNLVPPPRRQRCRVITDSCPDMFSTASVAELSLTGICPTRVRPPRRQWCRA